jgi:hypothetical protein
LGIIWHAGLLDRLFSLLFNKGEKMNEKKKIEEERDLENNKKERAAELLEKWIKEGSSCIFWIEIRKRYEK